MSYFGTVSSLLQSVDSYGLWGGLTVGLPSANYCSQCALCTTHVVLCTLSISPKIPLLLRLFFFSNVSLVLLLAKVCKPTRCSSTGYQYSELLFFSCLFSGQLKLHNGVLEAGIIDYIPATFTNSDTPSTNNGFILKATFCCSLLTVTVYGEA